MASRIRKVGYYSSIVPNRPGQGARILEALQGSKVNLLAFTAFPEAGKAQIDFVPDKSGPFLKTARAAGLNLRKKKVGFLVQGTDRVGAITRIMRKLSDRKVNVTAIQAVSAGRARFGAIFWVNPKNVSKAARILRAS